MPVGRYMWVRGQFSGTDPFLAVMGSGAQTGVVRFVWESLLPSEPSHGPESNQF